MKGATRFAMERLAAIDRAIRAGDYPNASSFAERMEVDARTIQRDLEFGVGPTVTLVANSIVSYSKSLRIFMTERTPIRISRGRSRHQGGSHVTPIPAEFGNP